MSTYESELHDVVKKHYKDDGRVTNMFFYDLFSVINGREVLGDRINDYVLKKSNPFNPRAMASYDYKKRKLFVYTETLAEDSMVFDGCIFSDNNMLHRYLFPIQTVLHEVDHAKQAKKILDGGEDFESKLVSICDPKMTEAINPDIAIFPSTYSEEKNKSFYLFNPLERMAEIRSTERALAVSSSFGINSIRLSDFFTRYLIANQLMGYNVCKSPTIAFLAESGLYDEFRKFRYLSSDFPDRTRVLYGLDVDNSYLDSLHNVEKRILSKYVK